MKKTISLVFFGSGPVACESLALLKDNFFIEAVVTKPTTNAEMLAVVPDVPVYSVSNKGELDDLFTTKKFDSNVAVLIDFGIIVSKKIIDAFPLGIINSHFSLLPELRGADPISFAILEGRKKTGVSLMLLVEAMDEGPLLSIGEELLDGSETTPSLTKKLIQLSYSLLSSTLPSYVEGKVNAAPQSFIEKEFGRIPSYTRKLTKNDGVIDWQKPAEQIEREIRAYAEWPKSQTTLGDINCTIEESIVSQNNESVPAGTVLIGSKRLFVGCGKATKLEITRLKPAGKKSMSAEAFIAGYKNRLLS